MNQSSKVIVALDVNSLTEVEVLVSDLAPHVAAFKIGLELISAGLAPAAIKVIHGYNGRVFYDGKFDDIPNTVAKATKEVVKQGVWMFNVHISAGRNSVEAAATARGDSLVIGVTVLTSMSWSDCLRIFGMTAEEKVPQFARNARESGLNGIVCSPQDLVCLSRIRKKADFIFITPGVRPDWAAANDQKRVMTPAEAVKAGADYLVIGRPITDPPKMIGTPLDAILKINAEIEAALVAV